MGSESEQCVDELLARVRQVEELNLLVEKDSSTKNVDSARKLVDETQTFIDNNKSIIPSFILKQVSEALRKLEHHINSANKSKLTFKFKAKLKVDNSPRVRVDISEPKLERQAKPGLSISPNFFGFQKLSGEQLTLGPNEVESKDISLVELDNCTIVITGVANTVYIRDLKETTVTVCLACRAITVKNCTGCRLNLVCQQLRIDSTSASEFCIFTSTRSMLEASKDLTFKELKLDKNALESGLTPGQVQQFMARANFNEAQNNWRCIDDFDWLSPDVPSKNYTLQQ